MGILHPEDELLDTQVEDFSNSHLVLSSSGRRGSVYSVPTLPPGIALKIFVDDYARNLFVSYPVSTIHSDVLIPPSEHPLEPPIVIDFESNDYYLHPALLRRRKRKRSDIYDFFADGSLDTAEW